MTPVFPNLLRLVGDDTAALRQNCIWGQCQDAPAFAPSFRLYQISAQLVGAVSSVNQRGLANRCFTARSTEVCVACGQDREWMVDCG